jgi:hypothetical protein
MTGITLGAGLMYILDPDRGNRRRALMRDKCSRAWHKSGVAIGKTSRDITNRSRGVVAEMSHLFRKEEAPDEILVDRVRSKMGRIVSHPGAIAVTAAGGSVTLSGPILAGEVAPLLKCVASVRGVNEIENQLEVHETSGDVPALQGGARRPGKRFELLQDNWSPTARLLTGIVGGALSVYGATRQDVPGLAMSALGLGIIARAATNTDVKQLVGIGRHNEADNQEGANAQAPPANAPEKHETARQGL